MQFNFPSWRRERPGIPDANTILPSDNSVPSFHRQTDFECGLYSLPGNPGTIYFNPGLVSVADRNYLFARRTLFKNGPSDLAIFDVSQAPAKLVAIPKFEAHRAGDCWEDPRVVMVDSRTYVSFARWNDYVDNPVCQVLVELSDDWCVGSLLPSPAFGGNGNSRRKGTMPQKNWVWFRHDDLWHCVYMTNPMTVFTMSGKRIGREFKHQPLELGWKFGDLRGGTPPYLLGDEYIIFFHSSLPLESGRRRYYMGAATFAATPPFGLRRIASEPILIGSENDPRGCGGPPCIFPSGSVLRDRTWLVSFGVNDEKCGWIKIPQSKLDSLLNRSV